MYVFPTLNQAVILALGFSNSQKAVFHPLGFLMFDGSGWFTGVTTVVVLPINSAAAPGYGVVVAMNIDQR